MENQIIYLSATNVADLLGVSTQTLRRWHREGKLSERGVEPVKRNGRWYFKASDLAVLYSI